MKHILAILFCALPLAVQAESVGNRLNSAADVLSEVMTAPDNTIPADLLSQAQCLVIVPGLKGGAFVFGGKYGKGFFSCRRGAEWTAPAAVRIEAGSFGFQIGLVETDLIIAVMNSRGAKRLLSSQFTLGSQGEIAGGPLGRSTSSQTDLTMRAEMLSWSRARGVFAGISLQGATLRQDLEANADIYGRRLRNKQIVYGSVLWPHSASELHSVLDRYGSRTSHISRRD